MELPDTPAGGQTVVTLPEMHMEKTGEYVLSLGIRQKKETPWADKGHEIAWEQFVLVEHLPAPLRSESAPELRTDEQQIVVSGTDFSLSFDRTTGYLNGWEQAGRQWLVSPLRPSFWRAPTDNDRAAGLPREMDFWKTLPERAELEELTHHEEVGFQVVTASYLWPEGKGRQQIRYRISRTGQVEAEVSMEMVRSLPPLPRIGLTLAIPASFDQIKYYGKGPHETYIDRQQGAKLGYYTQSVTGFGTPYIRPQEHGNHMDIRHIQFEDRAGHRLRLQGDHLQVSAWPYTLEALESARHQSELPSGDLITIHIDHAQMGVGGDDTWSRNARPHPEHMLHPGPSHWKFIMEVVDGREVDP